MLAFKLLGQVVLSIDGTPLDQFRSQKEAALLVYLAHSGEIHQRDFLAELLWESNSTKQSLTNLRTVLSRLRKKVNGALNITRTTIELTRENRQQVDSVRLWQALESLREIDSAATAEALQTALECYEGQFLANFYLDNAPQFNDWAIQTREQIHRRVLSAYDRLGQFLWQTNDVINGIIIARRWIDVDEFDEAAHLLLIQFLLQGGYTHEALAHYDYCVKLLREELGIEPSAEMTALIKEAQPQPTAAAAPPAAVLPTTAARQHNLPIEYDQFFGRRQVIEEIQIRLDQPWCRLVTIMGQGGVGKTRLALNIARSRLRQYPDGVWLVELGNIDPQDEDIAEAIAVEIATTLELRLTGSTTPAAQLVSHLQHKQAMLILDNFEHLLDDGVQTVLDLVQGCEKVQMLITSREPLRIRAEWTITLTGLNYPINEQDELPSEAVDLFVARRAQQKYATIAAESLTAIRTICQMVEGLPLAIELAAAMTRHSTAAAVADSLRDGFDALTPSLRDIPARHRGMHIVFEMSWQMLTPVLQQRLARLAIFRGGFSATAAWEIAEADENHLAALVEKSLLRHHNGLERYTLHPIIQAYAAIKQSAADSTAQKHGRYYLSQLAKHREPLQKHRPQASMNILEPDIENIRLAWQTSLAGRETAYLNDALMALSTYYQLRGLAHEGDSVMHATMDQAAAWGDESTSFAARAGLERARFQNRLGQARLAIQTVQIALKLAVQSKDRWAQAMALVWWGESLWRLGDYSTAETKLTTALKQAHAINSVEIVGWCHHQLGIINDIQSRYELALDHFEEAQAVWEELDHAQNLSNTLNSIGVVNTNKDDLPAAQQAMEQALMLCETIGNRHVQASLLNNLSRIAIDRGDYAGAQYYLNLGLKLAVLNGNVTGQVDVYLNIGVIHHHQGELGLAQSSLEKALESAQEIGNRSRAALAMLNLAKVKQKQNKLEQSHSFYNQALEIANQDNLPNLECEALLGLAELLSQEDAQKAKQSSAQAVTLAATIKNPTLLERAHALDQQLRTIVSQ